MPVLLLNTAFRAHVEAKHLTSAQKKPHIALVNTANRLWEFRGYRKNDSWHERQTTCQTLCPRIFGDKHATNEAVAPHFTLQKHRTTYRATRKSAAGGYYLNIFPKTRPTKLLGKSTSW